MKIGILFGGNSYEHDISIITGVQTLNALNKDKYDVVPIYISKDGFWYSSKDFFDIKTFVDITKFNNTPHINIIVKQSSGCHIFLNSNFAKPRVISKIQQTNPNMCEIVL